MKTIWKYKLETSVSLPSLFIPEGARFLHMDYQRDDLCLWFEVDVTAERDFRTFQVIGTGHPVPEGGTYLGTVQQPPYVWHVYEVGDEAAA